MRGNTISPKLVALVVSIVGLGVVAVGCGPGDDAPTNTKNSQYVNSGQTAADKIGKERAGARLPHHGQAPN